jgi:cytoskeleton protein RodZ
MSEAGQASVGQILRDAREAQGLSLDEAAARLRLMQRQIVAMEADEFESLGQPVFARGFVRNYSRLLGLEPDALLASMEGAPAEPAVVSHAAPPPPHSWLSSPWLILLLLGVLVVVTLPVALYWWLNEGEEENVSRVQSVEQASPVPPALTGPDAEPADATAPVAGAEPVSPAAPDMPAAPVAVPGLPAAPVAGPGETSVPAAPVSPVLSGVLHLEFGGESWVEIKDASGRMLHRQLNPAGSSVDVRGQPPFDLVIGNAAQARMTYNGRPIDLAPFIGVGTTVARFTLEE